MRPCFFGLYLTHKGGVENLSVNLIKHLAQNSDVDEIFVVYEGVYEDAHKSLKHKKVNMQHIGRPNRSDFLRIMIRNIRYRHLSNELNRFDILHVLDSRAFPFVRINVHPLVVTIHDVMRHEFIKESNAIGLVGIRRLPHLIDYYCPQMFVELLSAKKANGIIVNDAIIADRLRKLYGNIVAGKIKVIPAGFDPTKFNPYFTSRSDAKQFLKLDSSSKVLLHLGGCKERKGLPYLLHALDFMHKSGELDRLSILLLVLGKVGEKYAGLFPSIRKVPLDLN